MREAFKVGDLVMVLDDNLSGTIIKIAENQITIESADGFEFVFSKTELVKQDVSASFRHSIFENTSIDEVVLEKESKKRKPIIKKAKARFEPTLEVDLHIHQLTNSSKGMSNHDMLTLQLDTAKRQLDFAIRKRIQKVVFIHGVGEGVLKIELEYLFGRYNNVKFYEANYQKYGLGATEIYIYQNVKPND